MKAGWQVKKLGELGVTQTGTTPKTSEKENFGNYIPFVKPADFNNDGTLNCENEGLSEVGLKKARCVKAGSVLMVCIGTIGKCGFCTKEVTMNQQINSLTPLADVDYKFIYYQMLTENFRRRALSNAGQTTLPIINKSKWSELTVLLPLLPEQQRIVAILDEAFDAIAVAKANAEQNRNNARELFDSYLQSVFTLQGERWVEKPLGKIAAVLSGFSFKSPDFSRNNAINSIKITNVGVKEFVRETDSFLPEHFLRKYSNFSVSAGSIVIALTRSIISSGLKVAIVPEEYDGALLNQRVAAITAIDNIVIQKYLYAYLGTEHVFDYVRKQVNTLMQPNLSINDLRILPIPVPPLSEQLSIVARLDALSAETQRLESLYQQKIAALAELKQSLLQRAFAGEL